MCPAIVIAETIEKLYAVAEDIIPPITIDPDTIRQFDGLDLLASPQLGTGGSFTTVKSGFVAFGF